MKTELLFAIRLLILFSCKQNQRQVIKIDGEWNVKAEEIVGIGSIDPDIIYESEYCKLKQDEFSSKVVLGCIIGVIILVIINLFI